MVDVQQNTLELAATSKEMSSDAMKRISDWITSQEVASDVTVRT
nr:hypothetical protein [Tanacetum cinerariifolium]